MLSCFHTGRSGDASDLQAPTVSGPLELLLTVLLLLQVKIERHVDNDTSVYMQLAVSVLTE
jgi:hypothetical protein